MLVDPSRPRPGLDVETESRVSDQPLAARMRPATFEEYVGQGHLVGEDTALSRLWPAATCPSIILWGPAGTGKTTLAHLLADAVGGELIQLSAVSSGVADARKVMQGARGGMFRTVLFVDEVHRWSKAQQDVLLPAVEDGTITLIGATTENPYFSLEHAVAVALPVAAPGAAAPRMPSRPCCVARSPTRSEGSAGSTSRSRTTPWPTSP